MSGDGVKSHDVAIGAPGAGGDAPPAAPPDPGVELVTRLQQLIARVDKISDPTDRAVAHEMVGGVIELYGEGLRRIFDGVAEAGPAGEPLRQKLVADGVVASLMLIHDLYPVSIDRRVREALEQVGPWLETQGGRVTLLGLEEGVARMRLDVSRKIGAVPKSSLELGVTQALARSAPDLLGVEFEGAGATGGASPGIGFVPLEGLIGLDEERSTVTS